MTPKILLSNPDALLVTLKTLHDTLGYPWRKIAEMPEFSGLPAGTLASAAKGDYPIEKVWERLGGNTRQYKDLFAMPVSVLRSALENREELE